MQKLAYFLVLSMIAHFLILHGVPLTWPQPGAEPLPLTARLQPAEMTPPVLPRPRPKHALAPPSEPVGAGPPPRFATPTDIPASQATPGTTANEAHATAAETAAVETPFPAPAASQQEHPEAAAPAVVRRLPRNGEITYVLYLGANRFTVGRTRQTWEIHDDHYRLSSVSETSGLVSLFSRQRLVYESRGKMTARGLQPDYFTTDRMRSGKREESKVDFNWTSMTVAIGNPQRSITLPADAQDIVSFMYQLGLTSLLPGRIELPITNGWKLARYELVIGEEEQLETPMGMLRALPVRQVRHPGEESIDLWLAPEYRLLPVRIRFYDREGNPSGEQLVSELRISSD